LAQSPAWLRQRRKEQDRSNHSKTVAVENAVCFNAVPSPSQPHPFFMSELLQKFSLENAKFNSGVYGLILFIWIVVLVCAMTSILSQPFPLRQRIFWCTVVVIAPIIGILAYLPFSFRKEDLPQIFRSKRPRTKRREDSPESETRHRSDD
jgi:magnesium-transporting ATPase (P-type)